jgi:hypothetical protein
VDNLSKGISSGLRVGFESKLFRKHGIAAHSAAFWIIAAWEVVQTRYFPYKESVPIQSKVRQLRSRVTSTRRSCRASRDSVLMSLASINATGWRNRKFHDEYFRVNGSAI